MSSVRRILVTDDLLVRRRLVRRLTSPEPFMLSFEALMLGVDFSLGRLSLLIPGVTGVRSCGRAEGGLDKWVIEGLTSYIF